LIHIFTLASIVVNFAEISKFRSYNFVIRIWYYNNLLLTVKK